MDLLTLIAGILVGCAAIYIALRLEPPGRFVALVVLFIFALVIALALFGVISMPRLG